MLTVPGLRILRNIAAGSGCRARAGFMNNTKKTQQIILSGDSVGGDGVTAEQLL